jgi:FAD/FMN-containing dehydrogenase
MPTTVSGADRDSLRVHAPLRVLDGFGGAVRTASRCVAPRTIDELRAVLQQARREGLSVTFRGAGRSYGDAALNADGLVVDVCGLRRVIGWDPASGLLEAEPGLTIEDVWRQTLPDGFWPAVVPGTMRPTLGGCLAMNVHGKNNYKAGVFGDHVDEFELVTPGGACVRCSRSENAELFHAAIGGLGLMGAFTRVRLKLRRVETGLLRVEPINSGSLEALLDDFTACLPTSDYTVGWMDTLATGRALGRGVIHRATYVPASELPDPRRSLALDQQDLPSHIVGLPKAHLWRLMRPFMFDVGVRAINAAKYHAGWMHDRRSYLQSHVAFAFLLDYVPDWRLAYGASGFIQYQVFVPQGTARDLFRDILRRCQAARRPPYLAVLKRHRPDDFLLSHAVDGWSLALDFAVRDRREALWALAEQLTRAVLDAGGRFYFAKDAVLRPADVERAYGRERVARFLALKRRLDPDDVLTSDLWRRVTDRS